MTTCPSGKVQIDAEFLRAVAFRAAVETHVAEYRSSSDKYFAARASDLTDLRDRAQAAEMGYYRLMTDRPLDEALREYLTLRGGRN